MRSRTKLLSIGIALCLFGCVLQPNARMNADAIGTLTPTDLIRTAETRIGRTATVVGYFTWRTDTRALWEDRDAHRDAEGERKGPDVDYWAKCVTIYPANDARLLSNRRVRVTGKVTIIGKDDIRSNWTCNAVALEDALVVTE